MDSKLKHLEFIQGIVNRLSQNSFLLKGWSVVLVSALFALAVNQAKSEFVFLAYLPAIVFWGLDGYFLRQERLFRALYDRIRVTEEADIDFSMNVSVVEDQVASWPTVTLSKTLVAFHGALVCAIIIVMALTLRS